MLLDFQGHSLNGQSTTCVEESSLFKLMTVFQNLLALALESHKARSWVLSFLTYILLICKENLIVLAINMLMIQPYIKHRSLVNLHLALPQCNVMWIKCNAGQTKQTWS